MTVIGHIAALYGFLAPWVLVFWLGVTLAMCAMRDVAKLIRIYTRRTAARAAR